MLDLSHYATKKESKHVTSFHNSYIAANPDFVALKAKVYKLDINKLVNVPTSVNNLKIKVDDLHVGKLRTVPKDLEKLSGVVNKEVVRTHKT